MIGFISGKLTVISFSHIDKNAYWNCLCQCGNSCVILGNRLRSKKTTSCGCITKTQNGLSKCETYKSWSAMIQRCYDVFVVHYQRYGAKGIKVCERWKNSFSNFITDMGQRPKGKTLDRINCLGNYEISNCRWCTYKQQANNKSNNKIIEYLGKKQTLTQWAEEYSIASVTLRKGLIDLKWPIEKALTKKVGKYATSKG